MRLTTLIICTLITGSLYAQIEATYKVRRAWMDGDPPLYLAKKEAGQIVTIGYANGGVLLKEDLQQATQLYVPANYQVLSFRLSYGNEEDTDIQLTSFPTFNQDIREHLEEVDQGDTVKFSDIVIRAPDGTMILYRKMTYKVEGKRI